MGHRKKSPITNYPLPITNYQLPLMIRIVLILVVLGGLLLLVLQNLSPVLPMVFLGFQTVALSLSVWILLAIAAGFFTSLGIAGFFQLSNYLSEKELLARIRKLEAEKSPTSGGQRRVSVEPPSSSSYKEEDFSDEDFEDEEEDSAYDSPSDRDYTTDRTTFERQQEPKSTSQSGSVYSYSYRDSGDSGVGKTEPIYNKTESVYDADYRVITPPYRKLEDIEDDWSRKSDDDDDWGFDDDDDFDDDKGGRR